MENKNKKAKVLITGKGKNISAKFKFMDENNKETGSYSSYTYMKSSVNKDETTKKEYFSSIKATYIEDLIDLNKIEEIEVDKKSIPYFFGYEIDGKEVLSKTLTLSFIRDFVNYDLSTIYIYEINIENEKGWDNKVFVFDRVYLMENTWEKTYCNESVDFSHFRKLKSLLFKNNPKSAIGQEIDKFLKAQELSKEDVDNAGNFLIDYQNKIQKIINDNEKEIIEKFQEDQNTCYGLDCGWLKILSDNPEFKATFDIVDKAPHEINSYKDNFYLGLKLNFPVDSQSTTFQKNVLNFVADKVQNIIGDKLYSITKLD